jgi:hypothetical protein
VTPRATITESVAAVARMRCRRRMFGSISQVRLPPMLVGSVDSHQ